MDHLIEIDWEQQANKQGLVAGVEMRRVKQVTFRQVLLLYTSG